MSVSGTYRPPNDPKCPVRSGSAGRLPMNAGPGVEREGRLVDATHERPDLHRVLPAGMELHAGVHVDAPGPSHPDRLPHRLRREPAREDHAATARGLAGQSPGNGRPGLSLAPASRAVEKEGRRLVTVERGQI